MSSLNGLTDKELKRINDFIIKANEVQLVLIKHSIVVEIERRRLCSETSSVGCSNVDSTSQGSNTRG